uniref:GPI transamidase component PIG-T n=1 Tax=Spongospora subterranea TaxID=70186 RepID=A0A0H5QPG3_9EUKA|eukprot:CRZ03482.1 hypothetical protein [Spongospora subterranea]
MPTVTAHWMCDLAARTRRWITQQMILIAIALLAAIAPVLAFDDGEQFRERLLIRPLPDHNVLLHFDFNMTIDRLLDPDDEHYRFFPKSIAQIITKHQVGEFVLKLTQGRWRYAHWGLPVVPAPTGAELIAWVHRHDSDPTVGSQRWSGVQQSLSGMLCASLQQLGKNVHTCRRVPDSAIAPESRPVFVNTSTHETFYGVLPREAVCTENLTPWAKLLPCRTRGGLGRLLSPLDLHDASYHSMGIHVYSETNANNEQRTIARFFLSVVLDPTYLYRSKVWSLRSLLPHATLPMQCSPVSTECEVHFDAVNAINANGATPGLTTPVPIRRTGNVLVFDPTDFDLSFDPGHEYLAKFPVRDTPIVVQRYATGRGLQSGGIVNTVVNSGSVARNVTLFDTLPCFVWIWESGTGNTVGKKRLSIHV